MAKQVATTGSKTAQRRLRRPRNVQQQVSETGPIRQSEPLAPEHQPLAHPEELIARVHFEVGAASLQARVRTTPAGLVGVTLVLLSVATVVWAIRRTT